MSPSVSPLRLRRFALHGSALWFRSMVLPRESECESECESAEAKAICQKILLSALRPASRLFYGSALWFRSMSPNVSSDVNPNASLSVSPNVSPRVHAPPPPASLSHTVWLYRHQYQTGVRTPSAFSCPACVSLPFFDADLPMKQ